MSKLLLLIPLLLSGCVATISETNGDNIEGRCAEAESAMRTCIGTAPEGFQASCVTDPSEETFALVDDLITSTCGDDRDEKSDGFGETAFVSVCAPVVASTLLISRVRNNGADAINSSDKKLLRKQFGGLVDEVSFYFGARLIDKWDLGFTNVQFKFDVGAQTLGARIFVAAPYKPGNKTQLKLLAHELAHAKQSKRAGGFYPGFAYRYCSAFYQSSFSYNNNAMEIEAKSTASAFANKHL